MNLLRIAATVLVASALASTAYAAPPANWKVQTTDFLKASLKDPDSAKFGGWGMLPKPVTWTVKSSTKEPAASYTGYQVCVMMNAKNSYGGYVGATQQVVLLTDIGPLSEAHYQAANDKLNDEFKALARSKEYAKALVEGSGAEKAMVEPIFAGYEINRIEVSRHAAACHTI